MHPLSGALNLPYVRPVLLVVLWFLIGTRSRLLVVGLLSISEPLCPSRCIFGTILVTMCLMVCDWRVSRAEPISCWHDLLFLFYLLLFYLLLLPTMGWLSGVGVFGLIECFHSLPALHSGIQIILILIIIIHGCHMQQVHGNAAGIHGRHAQQKKKHKKYTQDPHTQLC